MVKSTTTPKTTIRTNKENERPGHTRWNALHQEVTSTKKKAKQMQRSIKELRKENRMYRNRNAALEDVVSTRIDRTVTRRATSVMAARPCRPLTSTPRLPLHAQIATPTRSSSEVNMPDAPRKPADGPKLDELRQGTKLNFDGVEWTAEEQDAFAAWLEELDPDAELFVD